MKMSTIIIPSDDDDSDEDVQILGTQGHPLSFRHQLEEDYRLASRLQSNEQSHQAQCRFCGGLTLLHSHRSEVPVCYRQGCQVENEKYCPQILSCGHFCGGARCSTPSERNQGSETELCVCTRPTCLEAQHMTTECVICQDNLMSDPVVKLPCSHVFHLCCVQQQVQSLATTWALGAGQRERRGGAPISFTLLKCPLRCDSPLDHPLLINALAPFLQIYHEAVRDAEIRSQLEGWRDDNGERLNGRDALAKCSYYLCQMCDSPYFGGLAECGPAAPRARENRNKNELLMCPGCQSRQDGFRACEKHGDRFCSFKCCMCCHPAVWFCFGKEHFCDPCHSGLRTDGRREGKKCPAEDGRPGECVLRGHHPPNPCEVRIGCAACLAEKTGLTSISSDPPQRKRPHPSQSQREHARKKRRNAEENQNAFDEAWAAEVGGRHRRRRRKAK